MIVTRRALLVGGAATVAATGIGGYAVLRGRDSGLSWAEGRLTSAHWPGRGVAWRLARPDPARVPSPRLVLALHGRGGNAGDAFDGLRLQDQVERLGIAIASVDGGERYWHPRKGDDTGALVIEDLLPEVRRHGIPAGPFGLVGWSMGGYGALWLRARYGPTVVGAVAAMSAALWTSPGASAAGAFDDREDFLAHDVFARTTDLARMPVSLACGTSDPFIAANRALAAKLPHAMTTFDAGGHDDGYWRPHGIRALEWCAAALAS